LKNKVLIITYYWPPYSSPGVQRWVKFVKYFNKFNIQPYVYTPQILSINQSDDSLILDIPKNVDVIKKPIFLFDKILKFFFFFAKTLCKLQQGDYSFQRKAFNN
jgi:hypothetical protein